jgi:hypothetical protein
VKVNLGMACNKIRIYKDANEKVCGYAIGVGVFNGEFKWFYPVCKFNKELKKMNLNNLK